MPGLAAAGSAVRSAARGVEAKGSSLTRWLLPLAAFAVLAALLWKFLPQSPAPATEPLAPTVTRAQSPDTALAPVADSIKAVVPDVSSLKTDLTDTFSKLTDAFSSVKDAASAEAALPKLQELEGKLDSAKTTMTKLGEAGKVTIGELVKATKGKLSELIAKVLAIPGVGEKVKKVADSIMTKLNDLAG